MPESQLKSIDWLYQNTFLDYNKQHKMWKVYKFCFASPLIIFLFSKSSLRLITNHVIIGVFISFISLIIKFSVYISAIHSMKFHKFDSFVLITSFHLKWYVFLLSVLIQINYWNVFVLGWSFSIKGVSKSLTRQRVSWSRRHQYFTEWPRILVLFSKP